MAARKTLPAELSFEALFHPNREFGYLRGADEHPFERVAEFSARDAWWLAELSLLSYLPEEEMIRAALARAGVTDVEVIEAGSTHCFIAGELVVFRGTDDSRDILSDIDTLPTRSGTGRVHRGFKAALDVVWDDVQARLDGREAWFAGHSLGAALATIAATRYEYARAVYTFGSPRVGDREFFSELAAPVHRVVNNNDIVTRLPPPLGYRHVGELQYLDADGRLHADPARWTRIKEQASGHKSRTLENVRRWLGGDFEAIPYDSLVNHSPLHYAIHLWNNYVSEK